MPLPPVEKPIVAVETSGADLGDRLTEHLGRWGYHVLRRPWNAYLNPEEAQTAPDVLLRELTRDSGGLVNLSIHDGAGDLPTILLDPEGDLPTALAARRAGTASITASPVDWPALRDAVSVAIQSGQRHRRLRDLAARALQAGGPAVTWSPDPEPAWVAQLDRIGAAVAPAVLWGEPGTGKRTLARTIHALGPRPDAPLVTLLGRAGMGTGAGQQTPSTEAYVRDAWAQAAGGTLIVDGVTDLNRDAQWVLVELLDAQAGPHGSPASQVRLVGTAASSPASALEDGDFGEDLYYRTVFVLPTSPLRKRREEIGAYAHHFMTHANRRHGLGIEGFRTEVLEMFRSADWPGNLSELRSTVERACILAESGWLDLHHLPPYFQRERPGPPEDVAIPVGTSAAEAERRLILATLERTGSNKAEAARQLEVDVKTIRNKLRSYGLG